MIFWKYLIRNMLEKKARSALILLAIMATAALFYASGAVVDTLKAAYEKQFRQYYGTADIYITPMEAPGAPLSPNARLLNRLEQPPKKIVPIFRTWVSIPEAKGQYIAVIGVDTMEMPVLYPELAEALEHVSLSGNRVVISERTAKRFGLQVGMRWSVYREGVRINIMIAGICPAAGPFLSEQDMPSILVSDDASYVWGLDGRPTGLLVFAGDQNIDAAIAAIKEIYLKCNVEAIVSNDKFDSNISGVVMPVKMVSIFVLLMSAFILLTSFKVVSFDRLPIVGTFRSVGATKTNITLLLLGESALFGVVGSALGSFAGLLCQQLMADILKPEWMMGHAQITPNLMRMCDAFLFAFTLTLFSTMFPLVSTARLPLKVLLLGSTETKTLQLNSRLIVGIVFLPVAFLLPTLFPRSFMLDMIVYSTAMTFVLVSAILLIPSLLTGISKFCMYAFRGLSGVLSIAASNVGAGKHVRTNATLLAVGISSLILMDSLKLSMLGSMYELFNHTMGFDIIVSVSESSPSTAQILETIEGIETADAFVETYGVETWDESGYIRSLSGVSGKDFLNSMHYEYDKDAQAAIQNIEASRTILVGRLLANKMKLALGDVIDLSLEGRKVSYTVGGFFETDWYSGELALVGRKHLVSDLKMKYADSFYLKIDDDAENVMTRLRQKPNLRPRYIESKGEMIQNNLEGIAMVFSVLTAFTQLAMLLGLVGIVNNLVVSFLERKRTFAICRSIGMSLKQLLAMLCIEALMTGALASFVGVLAGMGMLKLIPGIMRNLTGPMKMLAPIPVLTTWFLFGVGLMLAGSIAPTLKGMKANLVASLKTD